jgi:hypothetical protein
VGSAMKIPRRFFFLLLILILILILIESGPIKRSGA